MSFTADFFGILPPENNACPITNRLASQRRVGVEIELNHASEVAARLSHPLWNKKRDGSLHEDGMEFTFSIPLCGKEIVDTLEHFSNVCDSSVLKPKADKDTSVHVHVDIRDLTYEQIWNTIYLYCILERTLYKFADPSRYTNAFCWPLGGDSTILRQLANGYTSPNNTRHLTEMVERYTGLNLRAIAAFGSMEFRMHRGTFDAEEILDWVNILTELVDVGSSFTKNMDDMMKECSALGEEFLLRTLLPTTGQLLVKHATMPDLLHGMRVVQDIKRASNPQMATAEGVIETYFPNEIIKAKAVKKSNWAITEKQITDFIVELEALGEL